ncbi:hypothetical protein, partial [Acidithiobacillus thiooxidans]|uniref:hypothetical protein n=1 Tax=Acidithiobacillus thiooxidans TaxID=930 RepID=UPI0011121A80
ASHPLREAVLQILLNDHGINRQPPTQITKDVTLAQRIVSDMQGKTQHPHDGSTSTLLERYLRRRGH